MYPEVNFPAACHVKVKFLLAGTLGYGLRGNPQLPN
jgi:hypothetical protein